MFSSYFSELTRALGAVAAVAALVLPAAPPAHAAGVPGQGTWETTLQGRDLDGDAATFEAYYDTVLNLTWLTDANDAYTSGYISAAGGRMGWDMANTWAANLNVSGITGWRLPGMVDDGNNGCYVFSSTGGAGTDCGYNVDTSLSELAHLHFVTLGNKAYYDAAGNASQSGWGLSNTGPFANVQSNSYWSSVEYAPNTIYAWYFNTNFGYQYDYNKYDGFYAWAVRPGDVSVLAVPEPENYALALAGLTAVLAARGRRR